MPSERIQRRIDRLLDEADQAADANEWSRVRELAQNVLAFAPDDSDAVAYVEAASRAMADGAAPPSTAAERPSSAPTPVSPPHPERFAGDRYEVRRRRR
jgi:hypothetical protein